MMKIELIVDGLKFPEGPVALSDGSVIVTEISSGDLVKVTPKSKKEVIAHVGGGPNGAAFGPDGGLYICNNGGYFSWFEHEGRVYPGADMSPNYKGGSIQRCDIKTGQVVDIYTHYKGQPLVSPNDIVFDRHGGFWFTDYGGRKGETLLYGSLYYAPADGGPLSRARRHLISPNGVGLSPDGGALYFAETITGRLWSSPIVGPGRLAPALYGPGSLIATLPGYQSFDSLAVELSGNICVAGVVPGAIVIVNPDGVMDQIAIDDPVTSNICFGGEDMCDAFVTGSSGGCLYRIRWPRPGLKLNFNS